MALVRNVTMGQPTSAAGRYAYRLTLAMLVAAAFAGLCAAYFAVHAGVDYPEPLAEILDGAR